MSRAKATPWLTSFHRVENRKCAAAGPKYITDHARVMTWPSGQNKEFKMKVLREGSNGLVFMPEGDGLV
jgi:hypothetical protein